MRRLLDGGATRRRERVGRGFAAGLVASVVPFAVVQIGVSAAAVSSGR